jgi:hypothetical protein
MIDQEKCDVGGWKTSRGKSKRWSAGGSRWQQCLTGRSLWDWTSLFQFIAARRAESNDRGGGAEKDRRFQDLGLKEVTDRTVGWPRGVGSGRQEAKERAVSGMTCGRFWRLAFYSLFDATVLRVNVVTKRHFVNRSCWSG